MKYRTYQSVEAREEIPVDRTEAEDPARATRDPALDLQSAAGNRAVVEMLRAGSTVVQPKLEVGAVDDVWEHAADRAAHQALQRLHAGTAPPARDAAGAPGEVRVQRAPATGEHTDGAAASGGALDDHTVTEIRSASGGAPLASPVRRRMEHAFGADFGGVRVHADERADRLASSMGARAFTTGHDVFFRQREFDPSSRAGEQVLAHELAHVVQQNRGLPANRVQRLVDPETFKKRTKLSFGRKGDSGNEIDGFISKLSQWQTMKDAPVKQKIEFLRAFKEEVDAWLVGRGKKSSRFKDVKTLSDQIYREYMALKSKTSKLGATDFDGTGVATGKEYGGQMNKLYELEYGFGVDGDDKIKGEQFTALFKAQQMNDDKIEQTRGAQAGIKKDDIRLVERNMATQVLDKLLGGNLVPPTFRAKHNGVEGIVMQKVEGTTGARASKEDKQNPVVRRALSNLYLLDIICGQVDRHDGNYIIETKGGKIVGVKGIDNDISFGQDYKNIDHGREKGLKGQWLHNYFNIGEYADELKEIDRDYATRIVELGRKGDEVRAALSSYLNPAELDSTISRIESLARFLEPMLAQPNGVVKTKWE